MSNLEVMNRGEGKLRVIEVDFPKPIPGEDLKAFWKPAREIIRQRVEECEFPYILDCFVSNIQTDRD